jgi:hypothetical protein
MDRLVKNNDPHQGSIAPWLLPPHKMVASISLHGPNKLIGND